MKEIAIVIGASSGIGRALVKKLAAENLLVLAVARNQYKLIDLQNSNQDNISILPLDISKHAGRSTICEYLTGDDIIIRSMTCCAAEGGPVKDLCDVTLEEWQYSQQVNVEAPLFMVQLLMPYFVKDSRILFISSNNSSAQGLGCYCVSKAGMFMLYQALRDELKDRSIHVGCVMPGLVATQLIDNALATGLNKFEILQTFKEQKDGNKMLAPDFVAEFLFWLLTETLPDDFSKQEWNISQWIKMKEQR